MTTVKQLIEKLKEYPGDTVVSVRGFEGRPITDDVGISLVRVNLYSYKKSGYFGEHTIIDDDSDHEAGCLKGRRILIKIEQ